MIAWGKRVTESFRMKVQAFSARLGIDPNWLMACMAFESAETFSPRVKNMAGSGATGLIQFMPATAKAMGTSTEHLSTMSAEDQLSYVFKYFWPYKGRISSLEDCYMCILWPRAAGKPDDYPLFDRAAMPTTFRQNSGLDLNADGVVTKREAAAMVRVALGRGLLPENASE